MPHQLTPQQEQTTLILLRLEASYGVAIPPAHRDPLDELIACVLSQSTSDVNSFRAFDSLKTRFPNWEMAAEAPVGEVADSIRSGGLANSKAPRIQAILRSIATRHGAMKLDFLAELTDEEGMAYLIDLPGVGPKTAAIVLCFALGRPVLPVDTHVFRVAWRLGLIEKKIGEAKAHSVLQAQLQPELSFRFHVAFLTHGRRVCKAPLPNCAACTLTDLCRYYNENAVVQSPVLPSKVRASTTITTGHSSKNE